MIGLMYLRPIMNRSLNNKGFFFFALAGWLSRLGHRPNMPRL